jgi:Putative  PD-(D/E)XK family member, (DUF4420)
MAQRNERDELQAAWRALSGCTEGSEGWRTILLQITEGRLRAGRHFPGNEEALLVGFRVAHLPPAAQLPQGRGFVVSEANLGVDENHKVWLALSRRPEGSLDMFTMMAIDIIANLTAGGGTSEERLFQLFLARIRAWQEFMRRGTDVTLGPEAEVGLFGELVFLRGIIETGLPASIAIESWVGPLDSIQDFVLGSGAIEVKTSIATSAFYATIGSLDQLDDYAKQPLFLAAVRIQIDSAGVSLPKIIEQMQTLLGQGSPARDMFNIRVLHAGFLDSAAEHYTRCFTHVSTRIFRVSEGFPRLTRANVASQIIQVRYELNLSNMDDGAIDTGGALRQLGVI